MLNTLQDRAKALITENASTILTAGGVVGTVTTAVLAGRASFKAADLIREERVERLEEVVAEARRIAPQNVETPIDETLLPELTKTERVKLIWPLFIPPVLIGGATIGSIVMANQMSAQKAAALAAAYGLSERQLREYKEKLTEKLTPNKLQQIEDEIAQDQVNNTPGHSQIVVVEGEVLCFDAPTGRYFRSTMEKINRAVNATNAEILRHNYASAGYFYDELELDRTTWANEMGWGLGEQVELKISTTMSPDNRPCIVINFKTMPKPEFSNPYA